MGVERKPLQPGDKFGMLTVISKDVERTKERKKQYYYCQCDCGSPVKSILKSSLVDKRKPVYSCGCHTKYTAGYIENREVALAKLLYGKIKQRHTQKLQDREDLLLSFDEFMEAIKKPCVYCGVKESSFVTDRRDGTTTLKYNGLDRVDSSLGYRENNVVTACSQCNIAKGEMTTEEFKAHIIRIHKYQARMRDEDASQSD